MKKQINNLQSVGDLAQEQVDELEYGMGGLTAGELMFGDYCATLAVFGNTPQAAADNGARAYSAFLNSGAYQFAKSGHSAPSTWYAQVPNSAERPCSFPKTTENLACTFGIHNYSYGKKHGNPLGDGSAVMPLQTVSKTLFHFNFHFSNPKEDNIGDKIAGHTLILSLIHISEPTRL
ncbi:conjugal transfer protein, partial [Kingella kingae]|nr:conjugal transfer protein [Kingella kingae]